MDITQESASQFCQESGSGEGDHQGTRKSESPVSMA